MPKAASCEVNDLLTQCEPLIKRLVKLRLRGRPADVIDDVCQEVRLHLWRHGLPRFDPTRSKLTTYVFTCANRTIARQLKKLDRWPPSVPLDFNVPAPDAGSDRAIEALADLILSAPESYLSDLSAELLRAIVQHPDEPRGALAERLDIDPKVLWSRLHKVRQTISRLVEASSA